MGIMKTGGAHDLVAVAQPTVLGYMAGADAGLAAGGDHRPLTLRGRLLVVLERRLHAPWWRDYEARATRALLAVVETADERTLSLIAREILEEGI